ncbi:MAG: zinc-dependent metalloprotease [Chitinophagaceae bacterium]|nr:zinc-dependent metalloprotease [Chitinophagaceae bacterium]
MPTSHTLRNLVALVSILSFLNSNAQNKKTIPSQRDTSKTVQLTAPAPVPKGPKPYKEVITDRAITRKGLVTVHRIEEKWFFEIGDSILNRDILLVNRIAKAPANTRAGFFGYAGDEINQNVIRFEKGPNNKLFLRNISYSVYARDTAGAMYKSVMNSNVQPITVVFDVKAFSKDSAGSVIEVTDVLTGDNDVFFFSPSVKTALRLGGLQNDKSYILDIRPYPINTEMRTVKTYSRSSGPPVPGLPPPSSGGYATFELNTSMVLLPKTLMRPRYYDDRVSYFTTAFTDYDADPQGVKDISLITRWRLEPKPEDMEKFKKGTAVEPQKPIVFIIDPATPAKWIPYLIQGVKDWEPAFEKAGFKNAITARLPPSNEEDSSWTLEDARYSAIVYKPSEIPNASGPHIHDPRTGEILESHINWYHNVMKLLHQWYVVQAGATDPRARKPQFNDSLMGQLIRFVSSHEVGHTLGLPHNMGASSATPVEKLRDKKWVEQHGHTASIMDYARFNYVAQPEDSIGEKGLFPRINDYDFWAIEWGYKMFPGKTEEEEKKLLNDWVKNKLTNPRLRFIHFNGTDPRAQAEDLGDNAMKASTYGIRNLKRILPELPAWLNVKGEDFEDLDKIYDEVVTQYMRYVGHVLTNIGGIYNDRKTTDQAGAVYAVVPKNVQKEAMVFIQRNLFETPTWLLNKKILDLTSSPSSDQLTSIQDNFLGSMLSTSRLQRLISSSNREKQSYTIDEYFDDIKNALWSELKTKRPIDNYRRNLQKSFVERLSSMVQPTGGPGGGIGGITIFLGPVIDPRKSDIMSVSKATLRDLREEIRVALPGFTDRMSKYHLQDLEERIGKVLKVD